MSNKNNIEIGSLVILKHSMPTVNSPPIAYCYKGKFNEYNGQYTSNDCIRLDENKILLLLKRDEITIFRLTYVRFCEFLFVDKIYRIYSTHIDEFLIDSFEKVGKDNGIDK